MKKCSPAVFTWNCHETYLERVDPQERTPGRQQRLDDAPGLLGILLLLLFFATTLGQDVRGNLGSGSKTWWSGLGAIGCYQKYSRWTVNFHLEI